MTAAFDVHPYTIAELLRLVAEKAHAELAWSRSSSRRAMSSH